VNAAADQQLKELAQQLCDDALALADRGNAMPVIAIDGRAGSGKSTLASMLQNLLFKQGESAPRSIHLDDLYEGWQGLAAGLDYLQLNVLAPLTVGKIAHWQEYDWTLGKRAVWREFEGATPLIIEGCGAVNRNTESFAQLRVWIEADEALRRGRWQERDGHKFDEQWAGWAAQELDFIAREKSPELANYRLFFK